MSDFWETLAANSSSQLLMGSIDSLLSGKAVGDDFEGVRTLTDVHREANALPLPVEAGTKVSFIGTLGAYMGYQDPPPQGAVGEVVNVKSANGDVTHHEGKVFVQWDDGEFRPIHAEHLRLAGHGKTAKEHASPEALKKYLQDHPGADKSKHTVKDKGDAGKGDGEPDHKSLSGPSAELKGEEGKKLIDSMAGDLPVGGHSVEKELGVALGQASYEVETEGVTVGAALKAYLGEFLKDQDMEGDPEFLEKAQKAVDKVLSAHFKTPEKAEKKEKAAPPHHAKVNKDLKTLESGWEKIDPKKAEEDMRKAWGTFNEAVDRFDERADLAVKSVANTITGMFDKIGDAGAPRKSGEHLANMVKGLHSMAVAEGKGDAAKGYEKMGLGADYDPFKGREETDADYAEGLRHRQRRAGKEGKIADLKAEFEKIKALAEKKPDNKFLDSVLEQLSKGHTLTEKQLKVIKTIEGEVKEMASMQKQLKTLKRGDFDAATIGAEQGGPLVSDKDDKVLNEHFTQEDLHGLVDTVASVDDRVVDKKAEEDNWRNTSFRVASLGDLTDFLKVSDGTLVHKSTNDLWSVAADGEGFTLTRLFDDEGAPLQG